MFMSSGSYSEAGVIVLPMRPKGGLKVSRHESRGAAGVTSRAFSEVSLLGGRSGSEGPENGNA